MEFRNTKAVKTNYITLGRPEIKPLVNLNWYL